MPVTQSPYPDRLLPRLHFRKIETDLSGYYLCRGVSDPNSLNKVNDTFPESLFYDRHTELFDYSTNLLGTYLLEDNQIVLIGENKKDFYDYWDFKSEGLTPKFEVNFIRDQHRTCIFIPIESIHQKITLPLPVPPKKPEDTLTAHVIHTPTRSNFWHFSIRWVDQNGDFEKAKKSDWQSRMSSTMRHALNQLIIIDLDVRIASVPHEIYMKG